jgi:hypothetical protein
MILHDKREIKTVNYEISEHRNESALLFEAIHEIIKKRQKGKRWVMSITCNIDIYETAGRGNVMYDNPPKDQLIR